jgi:uncharacterized protein YdhG (YjbR/CyaY superfamily)
MKTLKKPVDIDAYIEDFPSDIQKILQKIRKTIQKAAPAASEVISYGIPTFKLNGNLVHFAAYKNHIGFYPTPSGIQEFAKELKQFKTAKGSIHFPSKEPFPYSLVEKMVEFRKKQMEK